MKNTLYRKQALENAKISELFDNPLRESNIKFSIVILCTVILLMILAGFGYFYQLPCFISDKAVYTNNTLVVYTDALSSSVIPSDSKIILNDTAFSITDIDTTPKSLEQVRAELENDYIFDKLSLSKWSYTITSDAPLFLEEGEVYEIKIMTETASPLEIILGKEGDEIE